GAPAPVQPAPRRARPPPRARLPPRDDLPAAAEPVPVALLGSCPAGRQLARPPRLRRPPGRTGRGGTAPRHDAGVGGAVGPLPLDRQRGADLLLVRLGVAPP